MHWSEKIAEELIKNNPNKEEYVCAAGISPSGSVHIGNFRDIATSYFVCKALIKKGKNAKLLFSWDEFDRFRKVPANVLEISKDFEQHIGKPYIDVPDPFGCCTSYAEHFEKEFEISLKKFGIEVDFRYQAREYRSGAYAKYIVSALKKRDIIFDILDSFRTQDATDGEKERYYPINIYCPVCGKDNTTITSLSESCEVAEYSCSCGHSGKYDFNKDFNCKLSWKIDWPMRWCVEGVDFEPGGKDHASPTGSYQTSKIISREIFAYNAPFFQGYEFIGIKGMTGKMSGSTGLNLTPATLLKLYQPEVILWLYSKSEPTKSFNFCFDDEILRHYFEFDKNLAEANSDNSSEFIKDIMHNVFVKGHDLIAVPMSQLVQLGSVVDFNPQLLEKVFEKIGTPFKQAEFSERLALAKFWTEQCSPENLNKLLTNRNFAFYETLNDEEKTAIKLLFDYLSTKNYSLDELNTHLYDIPKQIYKDKTDKEMKEIQGKFYKNVYMLLIGKEKGPRLYLFLFAIELEKYLPLLDFATPKTVAELALELTNDVVITEEIKAEINPLKDEILIEDFVKIDMRVCKVLKCEEIKKARKLYQLTLDDGAGERIIVSSIKEYYTPEQLINKKIIVISNLKPAKFGGVISNGMLLASTDAQNNCNVVFVDDAIPTGTQIG